MGGGTSLTLAISILNGEIDFRRFAPLFFHATVKRGDGNVAREHTSCRVYRALTRSPASLSFTQFSIVMDFTIFGNASSKRGAIIRYDGGRRSGGARRVGAIRVLRSDTRRTKIVRGLNFPFAAGVDTPISPFSGIVAVAFIGGS